MEREGRLPRWTAARTWEGTSLEGEGNFRKEDLVERGECISERGESLKGKL